MTTKQRTANETPERQLLLAIQEALEVPYPASYEDSEARIDLLRARVATVQGVLNAALDGLADADSASCTLRGATADMPPTYVVENLDSRDGAA
jgi:hypothetical protein